MVAVDDGVGIDPSNRHRSFAPFQRGRNARETGSGMHLGLVSRIVTQFGGRLGLEASERGACLLSRLLEMAIASVAPNQRVGLMAAPACPEVAPGLVRPTTLDAEIYRRDRSDGGR